MDTCQGWHVWLSVPPPLLAFYARPVCDFFSPGYLPLCWAVSVGCCCCCVFSCLITLPSLVTNIMGTPEREGDRRRERECVCECECASETPSLFCLRSLSEILRKSLPNFSICSETEICFCFGERGRQQKSGFGNLDVREVFSCGSLRQPPPKPDLLFSMRLSVLTRIVAFLQQSTINF